MMTEAQLRAHIRATPVEGSPDVMRKAFEARVGASTDVPASRVCGVRGRVFGTGEALVLWLHGGGYVFGSSVTHSAAAGYLATSMGARVFIPDYPLAPEAGWEEIVDEMAGLLAALGPVPVVGDSAGGHLALTLALRTPGSISRLALISPNTDRSGESRTRGAQHDAMNDDAGDRRLAAMAMPGIADDDPRASPLLADLSGLPPVWLTAATREVLLDDTALMVRALARAGVAVSADIVPGLFHLWPLWPQVLPQARGTLEAAGRHLAGRDG